DAGEHRRLVDAKLRRQFVEVKPRRFVDAQYRLPAVVTEVDVVEVDLEDFVFRKTGIEQNRQDDLNELALVGAFLRQKARFDDLLIDRASALGDAACAKVAEKRASHADRIDPRVVPEAYILSGQKCVRDVIGKAVDREGWRHPPVDPVKR